jgi:hypothetical protein
MHNPLVPITTTIIVVGASAYLSAAGQVSVGPVTPKPTTTLAAHETTLHSLLTTEHADKLWTSTDAATLNQLLNDLQGARVDIQHIIGPVPPKPRRRPPKPKPTKSEFEMATDALHRTLEEVSTSAPTRTLDPRSEAQMSRITDAFKGVP